MTLWQRWKRSTVTNQINIILTLLIALMTLTNVGFFIKQVRDQDRQVSEITTAITTGISKAKEAADAAIAKNQASLETVLKTHSNALRDALDAARQQSKESLSQGQRAMDASIASSRTDQRAWVGVATTNLAKEPSLDEEINISFKIRNTGKTPAIAIVVKASLSVREGIPPIPDWRKLPKIEPAMLFPGESSGQIRLMPGAPIITMTKDLLVSYQSRRTNIYGRIRIEYDDVFEGHHWTELCFMHSSGDPVEKIAVCGSGVDLRSGEQQQAK